MAVIKTEPINETHLSEVGQFLHQHMNSRFSSERWQQSLTHPWSAQRPNYGVQLRDEGQLVGVFCAIYSDQVIDGRVEKFCNPHSWCVLESHRRHSISLVLQLLKQKGYHFTMFTPNPIVTEVFKGLKFRMLDDRVLILPNLPSPRAMLPGHFVEDRMDRIAERLPPLARQEFEAHRDIPWLRFAAFGTDTNACLAIYKRQRWKRLPSAWLMHMSDVPVYERHGHLLRSHLLLSRGIATTRVEARWFKHPPRLAIHVRRTQPKLFQSATLQDSQIRDVYSELMSLDV